MEKIFGRKELERVLQQLQRHANDDNWNTYNGIFFSKNSILLNREVLEKISKKYNAIDIGILVCSSPKRGNRVYLTLTSAESNKEEIEF